MVNALKAEDNIVLVGMPGVGKSTVGVLLAKMTSRSFLDTDVYIQVQEGRRLQKIIDSDGMEAFCAMEEHYVFGLEYRACVIATGGSVIYSQAAMDHLKDGGIVVHLDLAFPLLERRITDLDSRGIVIAPGQTLQGLFDERQPLYGRWADVAVDCAGKTADRVVSEIVALLRVQR